MQPTLILAIVAALTIAEHAPGKPVSGGAVRVALVASAVALLGMVSFASSKFVAARIQADFACRRRWLTLFGRLQWLHTGLWLAAVLAICAWFGWPQVVRYNFGLRDTILLDELLILLPVLLPVVIAWTACYEVDRAGEIAAAEYWQRTPRTIDRARYVALHARNHLGLLLLPIVLILAVDDAIGLLVPAALLESYAWWLTLLPLGVVLLAFPWALKFLWRATRLPAGPLRERLEAAAARLGIATGDILVWHTGGRTVNAAVAGFLPRLRYVFLTDGLLTHFTDDEIEAVFAHEAGHIRGRHMLLRLLLIVGPLLLLEGLDLGIVVSSESGLLGMTQTAGMWSAAMPSLAILAYLLVTLGLYSRLLERQADLFACRSREERGFWEPVELSAPATVTFIAALEKVAHLAGTSPDRGTWLHPSVRCRVRFLRRQLVSAPHRRRFFLLTRGLEVLLFVLAAAGVLLLALRAG